MPISRITLIVLVTIHFQFYTKAVAQPIFKIAHYHHYVLVGGLKMDGEYTDKKTGLGVNLGFGVNKSQFAREYKSWEGQLVFIGAKKYFLRNLDCPFFVLLNFDHLKSNLFYTTNQFEPSPSPNGNYTEYTWQKREHKDVVIKNEISLSIGKHIGLSHFFIEYWLGVGFSTNNFKTANPYSNLKNTDEDYRYHPLYAGFNPRIGIKLGLTSKSLKYD